MSRRAPATVLIGSHEVHPLCAIFPELPQAEQEVLEAGVLGTGQVAPVLRFDGRILVGRSVLRACVELGLEPVFQDLPAEIDPLEALLAATLDRRHLTRSQRALAAGRVATLSQGRPEKGQRCTFSVEEAAKRFRVSPRLVKSARSVLKRKAKGLIDLSERGVVSVSRAASLTALDDEVLDRVLRQVEKAPNAGDRAQIIREVLEDRGLARARPADPPNRLMKESVEALAAHVREAEEPAGALGEVFEDLARQAGLRLREGVEVLGVEAADRGDAVAQEGAESAAVGTQKAPRDEQRVKAEREAVVDRETAKPAALRDGKRAKASERRAAADGETAKAAKLAALRDGKRVTATKRKGTVNGKAAKTSRRRAPVDKNEATSAVEVPAPTEGGRAEPLGSDEAARKAL
jgi:hypothetical protein